MIHISQYGDVTRIDSARTFAGRGYYWTTAYLVDGLLIDTGCAHAAPELLSALDGKAITSITNTHTHEDHIGANGDLQANRQGLEISAHPLALPILENPRAEQPLQFYRKAMWGWPKPSKGKPLAEAGVIETQRYVFKVLYTPGHSPDHICLYEPNQGWLFSGDLYVGGKDRALREGYDIWQIIASLKRVAALPMRRIYPGCARVRDNPTQALTNKIEYLESLGEAVLALHHRGKSEPAIVRSLLGGPMWIELVTSGHFSRRHLVRSYLNPEKGRKT